MEYYTRVHLRLVMKNRDLRKRKTILEFWLSLWLQNWCRVKFLPKKIHVIIDHNDFVIHTRSKKLSNDRYTTNLCLLVRVYELFFFFIKKNQFILSAIVYAVTQCVYTYRTTPLISFKRLIWTYLETLIDLDNRYFYSIFMYRMIWECNII